MTFNFQNTNKQYKINYSTLSAVTRYIEDGTMSRLRTFKIRLEGITEIFQNQTYSWNKSYPAAQQIFGTTTNCAIARRAIRAMHHRVYNKLPIATDFGEIEDGDDFLSLIDYGRVNGVDRMWTYVIRKTAIYFAETGEQFFRDFTSKHAIHADCAEEVVYAGEFHVVFEDGDWVIVFDNNSGTYAPVEEGLDLVKVLMEANFEGLNVRVLHHEDPELVEYRKFVIGNYHDEIGESIGFLKKSFGKAGKRVSRFLSDSLSGSQEM